MTYHLILAYGGDWKLWTEDSGLSIAAFSSKDEALRTIHTYFHDQPCILKIHDELGRIEEELTYP